MNILETTIIGILLALTYQCISTEDINDASGYSFHRKLVPMLSINRSHFTYAWSDTAALFLYGVVRVHGSTLNFTKTKFSLLTENKLSFPIYNGLNAKYILQIMPSIEGFKNASKDKRALDNLVKDLKVQDVYTWIITCNFINHTLLRVGTKDGLVARALAATRKWENGSIACPTLSIARFEITLGSRDMTFRTRHAEKLSSVVIERNLLPQFPGYMLNYPFRNCTIIIGGKMYYEVLVENFYKPDKSFTTMVENNVTFNIFTHRLIPFKDIYYKRFSLPIAHKITYLAVAEYEGNFRTLVEYKFARSFYYMAFSKKGDKLEKQLRVLDKSEAENILRQAERDEDYYPEVVCLKLVGKRPFHYFRKCTYLPSRISRITIPYN